VLKHRAPLARESHSPAKKKTAVYMYVWPNMNFDLTLHFYFISSKQCRI
jgi:hypothetical protein